LLRLEDEAPQEDEPGDHRDDEDRKLGRWHRRHGVGRRRKPVSDGRSHIDRATTAAVAATDLAGALSDTVSVLDHGPDHRTERKGRMTGRDEAGVRVRRLATHDLGAAEVTAIRTILDAAFASYDEEEHFTEDDWLHALGGTHVVVDVDGEITSHAAVVERELRVADRPLRTGYVEAVGTAPDRQARGFGTIAMEAANEIITARFEIGALGTGRHAFYERLGWRRWRGPLFARTPTGDQRTPDDEGYILVLRTPSTPVDLDVTAPLVCDWRPGDVW
jgi:aminoglycoside 2'-N-acetyltransferase I